MQGVGVGEISVLPTRYDCEHKTALKTKVYYFKICFKNQVERCSKADISRSGDQECVRGPILPGGRRNHQLS